METGKKIAIAAITGVVGCGVLFTLIIAAIVIFALYARQNSMPFPSFPAVAIPEEEPAEREKTPTPSLTLEEAKARMEKERKEMVDATFDHLDEPLFYLEERIRQAFLETKEQSVPRLLEAMRDNAGRTTEKRFYAGLYLLSLGYPEGFEVMKEFLEKGNKKAKILVLDELPSHRDFTFTIWDESVTDLILKLVDNPDPEIQEKAVWKAYWMEVEGFEAKLKELAKTGPDIVRRRAISALVHEGRDPDILDWLIQEISRPTLFDEKKKPEFTVTDLYEFLKSDDEKLFRPALEALEKYVVAHEAEILNKPFNFSYIIGMVADHGGREMVPFLKKAISGMEKSPWYQSDCLMGISRIEGADSRDYLQRCVKFPGIGIYALEALAEAYAGSGDEAVMDSMIRAASEAEYVPHYSLAKSLLRVGGDKAMNYVNNLMPDMEASERLEILRITEGRTLETELQQLVNLGLLQQMPDKSMLDKLKEGWGDGIDSELLWQLYDTLEKTGIMLTFDSESDEIPPPYDNLIRRYAGISSGLFKPEWVHQEWDAEALSKVEDPVVMDPENIDIDEINALDQEETGVQVTVRFASNEKLYEIYPEDMGDWYDYPSVTEAINQALEDAGQKERFVDVMYDGQCAALIFGDPEIVNKAAEYLGVEEGN